MNNSISNKNSCSVLFSGPYLKSEESEKFSPYRLCDVSPLSTPIRWLVSVAKLVFHEAEKETSSLEFIENCLELTVSSRHLSEANS